MTSGTASSSKCKGTTSQLATSWQVNTGGGKRLAPELQNQNNIVSKYFLLRGESALVGFSENSVSVKNLGSVMSILEKKKLEEAEASQKCVSLRNTICV